MHYAVGTQQFRENVGSFGHQRTSSFCSSFYALHSSTKMIHQVPAQIRSRIFCASASYPPRAESKRAHLCSNALFECTFPCLGGAEQSTLRGGFGTIFPSNICFFLLRRRPA